MTWTKLSRIIDEVGDGFLSPEGEGFLTEGFLAGPNGTWTKLEKVTDD